MRQLKDENGDGFVIGEQRDVNEFNITFLEHIEEGLGEKRIDPPKILMSEQVMSDKDE